MAFLDFLPLIGTATNVLSGLFGSSVQSGFTKEQQRLQHTLNKNEMAYSTGLQRSQQEWQMNSLYPSMVSGMKSAGLNPAMANGTTPATPSGGSPSSGGSGPSAGMPNLGVNLSQDLLNLEQTKANIELTKAQAKKTGEESDWLSFQNSPDYKAATLSGVQNNSLKSYWDAMKSKSDIDVNDARIVNLAKQNEELAAKIGLYGAQKDNFIQSTANMVAELGEIKSRIRLNEAAAIAHKAAAKASVAAARLSNSSAALNERAYQLDMPWYDKEMKLQNTLNSQATGKGIQIANDRATIQQKLEAYFYEVKTSFNLDHRAYWEIVNFIMSAISPMSGFAPSTSYSLNGN